MKSSWPGTCTSGLAGTQAALTARVAQARRLRVASEAGRRLLTPVPDQLDSPNHCGCGQLLSQLFTSAMNPGICGSGQGGHPWRKASPCRATSEGHLPICFWDSEALTKVLTTCRVGMDSLSHNQVWLHPRVRGHPGRIPHLPGSCHNCHGFPRSGQAVRVQLKQGHKLSRQLGVAHAPYAQPGCVLTHGRAEGPDPAPRGPAS